MYDDLHLLSENAMLYTSLLLGGMAAAFFSCWREAWLLTTLHAQETKIDIEMDIDEMQIVIEVIVEIKEEIEIEVDIEIEKGQ